MRKDTKCEKSQAFTLAELLMAVLVISIIMVALAPVITKRVSDNLSIGTNETKGQKIYIAPGDYEFVVPDGINVLHIKGAGGGGSGGYRAVSTEKTQIFNESNAWSETRWNLPAGVEELNFEVTGAGGDGARVTASPSGESCGSYEYEIPRVGNDGKNICLKPGNESYYTGCKNTESGVFGCLQQGTSADNYTFPVCWYHTPGSGYNGLYCTFDAINRVCANSGSNYYGITESLTRFIMNNEFALKQKFGESITSSFGVIGSAFSSCTHNNSMSSWCYSGTWTDYSGTVVGVSGDYRNAPMISQSSDLGHNTAYEVRCMKDIQQFIKAAGGGGYSGPVLKNTLDATKGGYTLARAGRLGGNTTVYYYDKDGNFIRGYNVYAGSRGPVNNDDVPGKPNSSSSSDYCYECLRYNSCAVHTACTIPSYPGTAGDIYGNGGKGGVVGGGTTGAAQGGTVYYDPSRGPLELYTASELAAAQGQDGPKPGYGGGGGAAPSWLQDYTTGHHEAKGGNGAGGQIKLTYKVNIPGGGGGGGAVVDGKGPDGKAYELKLKVTPGDKLKIHVGKGGTGYASVATKGEDTFIQAYNAVGSTQSRINLGGGGLGKVADSTSDVSFIAAGGQGGALTINSSYVKFSHTGASAASFKGANGYAAKSAGTMLAPVPGYTSEYAFQNNGIEGGMGSGCGGQLEWTIESGPMGQNNYFEQFAYGGGLIPNQGSSLGRWVSNTEKQNGQDGAEYKEEYNTTFNQYCGGGRGGGGAGSFSTKAGSGSHGYVVIRWDSKENEF